MYASMIIPITLLVIVLWGLIKKEPIFTLFTDGVKEGLHTMYSIAPSLIGLITAIGMVKASGILDLFTSLLSPVTDLAGIPEQITPLMFLKPISGSGSLALLDSIIKENGANSLVTKIAAVMTGSTETTFYCIAVYYGAVKINKTGCTVPCALIGDFIGMMTAIIVTSHFG